MEKVNISAFAKLVGVNEGVIRRAIKRGRVMLDADGRIDVASQTARWELTRDASKVREPLAEVVQLPGTRRGAGRPATTSTPEASKRAKDSLALKDEKTGLEIALLREELSQVKKDTVSKEETRRALASFARLVRDKWVNFANRYGQQIAAAVGADPRAVMAEMDKAVRLQLDEIANAKPTLPE